MVTAREGNSEMTVTLGRRDGNGNVSKTKETLYIAVINYIEIKLLISLKLVRTITKDNTTGHIRNIYCILRLTN